MGRISLAVEWLHNSETTDKYVISLSYGESSMLYMQVFILYVHVEGQNSSELNVAKNNNIWFIFSGASHYLRLYKCCIKGSF